MRCCENMKKLDGFINKTITIVRNCDKTREKRTTTSRCGAKRVMGLERGFPHGLPRFATKGPRLTPPLDASTRHRPAFSSCFCAFLHGTDHIVVKITAFCRIFRNGARQIHRFFGVFA